MPVRQVNGREFRYLEAAPPPGVAPRGTLLLVHAFPTSAVIWEPQMAMAARGWRVVAPQLRGFAGGTGDPPAASMDDYAADLLMLADALSIDTFAVGGVSMGGYILFALLRRAASRVRAIVLANTRPQGDTPEGIDARRRMLRTLEARGPAGVADEMVPRLLGETTRRRRPDLASRVRALVLANAPQAIAGAITAMMTRPDSMPLLASIACPVLVVGSEEDAVTPPDVARAMQRAIPGAELVILPDAGHLSNLEQPDAFNDALARFLDRL